MKTREEIEKYLDNIQFLSPNEPLTRWALLRVLRQIQEGVADLGDYVGKGGKTIDLWDQNVVYQQGDIVLLFKQEKEQKHEDVPKREFAFILSSLKNDNISQPNYDMVDGIPDFTKSNWSLLNPMSYLLQDLIGMKEIVKEVFQALLNRHVKEDHGLVKSTSLSSNLLKKDYSNLQTAWGIGDYSLVNREEILDSWGSMFKQTSNGIMEYCIVYSLDANANQSLAINDRQYYYEKDPILDKSDNQIFSTKYSERNMFSVTVHKDSNSSGIIFSNLRYGTNIFHRRIDFKVPFINDEYMVFFDTYGNGQFVFGYDKADIQGKIEPTYDSVVSMPMLLNKTASGFDIVLPIHTYFNSMQKYNIGVPWNNVFAFQAIGRYR